MGSTILTQVIGGVPDNRIALSNSYFARPFNFGTHWNKIRIALLATISDSGGNLTGTPRLAIGLCSGSSNIFGDATVTNFCGVLSVNPTWTRFISPVRYLGIGFVPAKMTGSTLATSGSQISAPGTVLFDAAAADRQFVILDITKGSPNYTFNIFGNINGFVGGDVDLATFIAQSDSSNPTFPNCAFGTDTAFTVDESAGTFDHANISWDQTASKIELSALRILRLA